MWLILTIIVGILGAVAIGFASFKVDTVPKLLKEKGDLPAGLKILDKVGSVILFLSLTLATLVMWIGIGIFICAALISRNWSDVTPGIIISSILGILFLFLLLYNWRRGNFDISKVLIDEQNEKVLSALEELKKHSHIY